MALLIVPVTHTSSSNTRLHSQASPLTYEHALTLTHTFARAHTHTHARTYHAHMHKHTDHPRPCGKQQQSYQGARASESVASQEPPACHVSQTAQLPDDGGGTRRPSEPRSLHHTTPGEEILLEHMSKITHRLQMHRAAESINVQCQTDSVQAAACVHRVSTTDSSPGLTRDCGGTPPLLPLVAQQHIPALKTTHGRGKHSVNRCPVERAPGDTCSPAFPSFGSVLKDAGM